MKKYLLVALAAVGMAACVQTEELGVANNKEAIAFDTFVDNATKASAYDNNNPLDHFNVYGTISKDENGTKTYVTTIFDGVEVLKSSTGVWAYDPQFTQYWVPGFTYDFAAVVDAKEVVCENGLPATIKTDMTDQNDVLYATVDPRYFGANDTAAKVSFQLAHLLSKAKFTVKNTIENGQGFVYNVESIKIKNADWNGAYDVATGVWAADDTYEADFGVNASLAKGSQESGSDVYLLPSANKDLDIEVVYNLKYNGATLKEETKTIAAVLTLEKGKAYNFVVEFGEPGEEIEFEATVRDWANGSVEVFQGVSVPVTTADELVAAIANPEVGEAVLMNDIDLTSTITRSGEESTPVIAKSFVIDGKGNKLNYSGNNRVIDITYKDGENDNLVVTIKDLTINCSAKYCQRGINYNAGGLLIIDNVKFVGTAPTYAVNCPASSDNAVVKIKNSEVKGNIALNLWGENMKVDVTDSHLISVDNTEAENYSAITLNNDGTYVAEGTVVNIEGGSVIARDEKNEPSYAVRNSTATGCVNISESTEVVGEIKIPVAIVAYEGYSEFYSFSTVQEAIDKVQADKNGTVRLIKDLELTEPIVVAKSEHNVVLDLNGHTLSAVENATGSYALITNLGKLTIAGSGKLELSAKNDRDWNAYSSVISNQPGGTLTVNGGTIEHLGGTDMAYAIDNLTNGNLGDVTCTINGGLIKSTYRAIRQFLNSDICMNTLTVNGGTIVSTSGNKSIWMQDPSKKANTGKLVVKEGAHLQGDVYLYVCEGSTEWPVEVSIASAALDGESTVVAGNVPDKYVVVEENGVWTVAPTPIVVESAAELIESLKNIVDGGTIILSKSFDFTATDRTLNSGSWYDGIYYVGDKSFTIDLGGKTVGNTEGAVNDYLFNFKNDGEKANTITIKNGTLDAGTAAFCALCSSSVQANLLTVNLEGVHLINNMSNGSTIKWRGGAILNVKAGTKITGKNSYLGIENWAATVNIYDGAEIYMNGTASYNGCLAGVGGNGVINVYGGYGKGVSGGLIAMTSGGTINVSGGEWIANTDGTYANSNKSVLVAQSDKQYNAGAGNAVVNVTGGTFKGGFNCYGNAVGDAQINISGGNFNANPTSYLYGGATATENNGIWTVTK